VRALVLTGPDEGGVQEVPAPVAGPGEVVVDVERVGVCGTDVELFTGELAYFESGHTAYPVRPGHEWSGRVTAVGAGVDGAWLGRRVMAEQLAVPAWSLHALPDAVDATLGALVEPGGNARRAAQAAAAGPDDRVLVLGPGTIGLLTAMFLRTTGAEVHLAGVTEESLAFARELGFADTWAVDALPDLPFDAVVDATTAAGSPALALDLVEPGGRLVCIGISGLPSTIDTRTLLLKDVTAVGILSGSPGLDATIAAYASGEVDPRPLVAATVGLDLVPAVLAGVRVEGAGPGPKIHVDPRLG
jgi:threonine dehydrogenase-like Zn-dependent dehydrogenase